MHRFDRPADPPKIGREDSRMKFPSANDGRKLALYVQIAEKIKEEIRRMELHPHDPIPSEGEWVKLYSVSRMTTKLALVRHHDTVNLH
jgi:DNA-binding GntR family transcriptional regulator